MSDLKAMTPPDLSDEQIEECRENLHGLLTEEDLAHPEIDALCRMALRVWALERLADIGRQWNENSSLEKWFPFTAEHLDGLKRENAALRLAINTATERAEASAKDAGSKNEALQMIADFCDASNTSGLRPEQCIATIYAMAKARVTDAAKGQRHG